MQPPAISITVPKTVRVSRDRLVVSCFGADEEVITVNHVLEKGNRHDPVQRMEFQLRLPDPAGRHRERPDGVRLDELGERPLFAFALDR